VAQQRRVAVPVKDGGRRRAPSNAPLDRLAARILSSHPTEGGRPCKTTSTPRRAGTPRRTPWNIGRLVGQKPPLKLKDLWGIRLRLQLAGRVRDLALCSLAVDSTMRGCDLERLRVADAAHGAHVLPRATVLQQKTGRPVRFELTEPTREAVQAWLAQAKLGPTDPLFPSRSGGAHLSTRQYARIVKRWVALVGLDPRDYGARSLRRTNATLICSRTRNLRAVQLLLGHSRIESPVRYLGVEVDDALEIAEQTEV
jgi:integrase